MVNRLFNRGKTVRSSVRHSSNESVFWIWKLIIVSFLTDLIILRFFLICVFLSLFFRFVRCRPLRVCHKLYYIETGILYQRLPRDILSWFYDIVLGDTMGFGSVLPELKINRKCIAKVMSLIHVKPCVFLRSKLLFSSKFICDLK